MYLFLWLCIFDFCLTRSSIKNLLETVERVAPWQSRDFDGQTKQSSETHLATQLKKNVFREVQKRRHWYPWLEKSHELGRSVRYKHLFMSCCSYRDKYVVTLQYSTNTCKSSLVYSLDSCLCYQFLSWVSPSIRSSGSRRKANGIRLQRKQGNYHKHSLQYDKTITIHWNWLSFNYLDLDFSSSRQSEQSPYQQHIWDFISRENISIRCFTQYVLFNYFDSIVDTQPFYTCHEPKSLLEKNTSDQDCKFL